MGQMEVLASTVPARLVLEEYARKSYLAALAGTEGPVTTRDEAIQIGERRAALASYDEFTVLSDTVKAFRDGQIFFFWNDRQVEDLEESLHLHPDNRAVFLKLFPMKGG